MWHNSTRRTEPAVLRGIALVLSGALLLCVAGCTSGSANSSVARKSATVNSEVVGVEASDALPSATLTDWLTYADFVVSATVESETRQEPSDEELASSSVAFATRTVRLKVQSVLWSAEGDFTAPEELRIPAGGWLAEKGKEERPFKLQSAVNYELHRQYLLPITIEPTLSKEWSPISARAVLPFDKGIVGNGEVLLQNSKAGPPSDDPGARSDLWNRDAEEVAAILRDSKPDPLRAEYADLTPLERSLAIQKARD